MRFIGRFWRLVGGCSSIMRAFSLLMILSTGLIVLVGSFLYILSLELGLNPIDKLYLYQINLNHQFSSHLKSFKSFKLILFIFLSLKKQIFNFHQNINCNFTYINIQIINISLFQMRATRTVVPPPSAKSPNKTPTNNPKVKKEVPTAWRDRVTPEDYEHLRDVFLIFDEDGSGTIDPQEIVKVLEEVGLDKRNQNVVKIIWALRETNKILTFEEFVDVVCTQVGEYRTRDGLQRVWKLYDKEETGVIRFEQLKEIARSIGEYMDDQAILDMMHGVFINKSTQSNEEFTFEEFYTVISAFYNRGQ